METYKKLQILPRDSQALRDLIRVVRPTLVVEFGSWEGRSALTFMLEAKSLGLESKIVCVDTWLGSAEHWENLFPDSEFSFDRLNVTNGEPRVLDTFLQTIKDHNLTQETSIVRAPTRYGAAFLRRTGVKPDLVYIDGDHSFGAVLEDLRLAQSIIAAGGVIAGDDFSWQSVRLAIARFARKGRVVMTPGDRSQFVVLDSAQVRTVNSFLRHGWSVERFITSRELPSLFRRRIAKPLRRKLAEWIDGVYLAARIPELKMRFRAKIQ